MVCETPGGQRHPPTRQARGEAAAGAAGIQLGAEPDAERGGTGVWVDETLGRIPAGALPGAGDQPAGIGVQESLLEHETAGESSRWLKRCARAGQEGPARGHRPGRQGAV